MECPNGAEPHHSSLYPGHEQSEDGPAPAALCQGWDQSQDEGREGRRMLCGPPPPSPAFSQQTPSGSHQGRLIRWLICTAACCVPTQGSPYQQEPRKGANPEVQLDADYGANHSQAAKLPLSTQAARMGLSGRPDFLRRAFIFHPMRNPSPLGAAG